MVQALFLFLVLLLDPLLFSYIWGCDVTLRFIINGKKNIFCYISKPVKSKTPKSLSDINFKLRMILEMFYIIPEAWSLIPDIMFHFHWLFLISKILSVLNKMKYSFLFYISIFVMNISNKGLRICFHTYCKSCDIFQKFCIGHLQSYTYACVILCLFLLPSYQEVVSKYVLPYMENIPCCHRSQKSNGLWRQKTQVNSWTVPAIIFE